MRIYILLITFFCYNSLFSDWEKGSNWIDNVKGAFVFQFDEEVYIGGGQGTEVKKSFGVNNLEENSISKLDDLPFGNRAWSFSFVLDGKGYVGCGDTLGDFTGSKNDFWEFDPLTNEWKRLDDFPGKPRVGAISFEYLNHGYVCGGFDGYNSLKDVYRYNPQKRKWDRLDDYPEEISFGIAEEIDNRVFIGLGGKGVVGSNRLYEYSELNDETWTRKADFIGESRQAASSFSFGDKLYFGGGHVGFISTLRDFYSYDYTTDTWQSEYELQIPNYITAWSISFYYKNYAYFGLGADVSNSDITDQILRKALNSNSGPILGLDKTKIEFDDVYINESETVCLRLSNEGSSNLNIKNIKLRMPDNRIKLDQSYIDEIDIKPNSSIQYCITIRSHNVGIVENDLQFETNDPKEPLVKIPITAKITDETTSVEQYRNKIDAIYPNPSVDIVTITFDADIGSNLVLSIFDILGNEIDLIESGIIESEQHSLDYNISQLPVGVYFIRLELDGEVNTWKFIKQ